jgi:Uncharacterized membrane protein, required for spore maturation in B.subtilis.
MLNYLWGSMILIGILFSVFSGNLSSITNAAINSSREAVNICLTMLGILAMWTGLISIAEKSGLINSLAKKMMPLLKFLFPRLPEKSKAMQYICTNIIANMLGLSWAATPAGLKAMEELQKINLQKDIASREMCMFMIINMSSLQIVSINIIAYRAQYNSMNPSEIIGPGLFATFISTITAIIITKIFEKCDRA